MKLLRVLSISAYRSEVVTDIMVGFFDEIVRDLEGSMIFIINDFLEPDFNLNKQSKNERQLRGNKNILSRL